VEVVIGLAHQVMLPLVADPPALDVPDAPAEGGDEELLLHAAAVSAATAMDRAMAPDRLAREPKMLEPI
jgi:hypothetical protein